MTRRARSAGGRFTKDRPRESREKLLFTIASWFHDIYQDAIETNWLSKIVKMMRVEKAAIVSFKWDLVLGQLLFSGDLKSVGYGLSEKLGEGSFVLKPQSCGEREVRIRGLDQPPSREIAQT